MAMQSDALRRKCAVLLGLGAFAFIACQGDPGGPLDRSAAVQVKVEHQSITLLPSETGASGDLAVRIRNGLEDAIAYFPCAEALARRVEGEWIGVWRPLCDLGAVPPPVEIPAGTERLVEFHVYGQFGVVPSQRWTAPIAGSYRVWLWMGNSERDVSTWATFEITADK